MHEWLLTQTSTWQPGYGTSHLTGKYLLERTLADYSKQVEERGKDFQMKDFFDILNAID